MNVMIDLETLGTAADAHIVSIGVCHMENPDYNFYRIIDPNTQCRAIEPDTVAWWMRQSSAARAVFKTPKQDMVSLNLMLRELVAWLNSIDVEFKHLKPWSHGATFDVPILDHAFKQAMMKPPWRFWNVRDTRTILDLMKKLDPTGKIDLTRQGDIVHHNALDDVIHQTRQMKACHELLGIEF